MEREVSASWTPGPLRCDVSITSGFGIHVDEPVSAGGTGNGTGAGANGSGEGDGGNDAELIAGRIADADIPQSVRAAAFSGTTRAEIGVSVTGQVTGCRISRSSGNSLLDGTTCRLIIQRFRFHPARDAQGHARPDSVTYEQEWTISGHFGDEE